MCHAKITGWAAALNRNGQTVVVVVPDGGSGKQAALASFHQASFRITDADQVRPVTVVAGHGRPELATLTEYEPAAGRVLDPGDDGLK